MSVSRYEDLDGSQYLSPEDLKPGEIKTVSFDSFKEEELTCNVGGRVNKGVKVVMTVPGAKKKVAINKTSAKALSRAWGKDFKDWVGKPVTIQRGRVNNKPCVLVRPAGMETETEGATQDNA